MSDCERALIEEKYSRWDDHLFTVAMLYSLNEEEYDSAKTHADARYKAIFEGSLDQARERAHKRAELHEYQSLLTHRSEVIYSKLPQKAVEAYAACLASNEVEVIVAGRQVGQDRVQVLIQWKPKLDITLTGLKAVGLSDNLTPHQSQDVNSLPLPLPDAGSVVVWLDRTGTDIASLSIEATVRSGQGEKAITVPIEVPYIHHGLAGPEERREAFLPRGKSAMDDVRRRSRFRLHLRH